MYRVQKGHRVRVALAGADIRQCWPTPKKCETTVHAGSKMILPIVPPPARELPPPDLKPSPYPLPKLSELPPPEYSLTQDLINQTATVHYAGGMGAGRAQADYTVSRRNPAHAIVRASYDYRKSLPGTQVHVRTDTLTPQRRARIPPHGEGRDHGQRAPVLPQDLERLHAAGDVLAAKPSLLTSKPHSRPANEGRRFSAYNLGGIFELNPPPQPP
jgi:hypothetical protein